MKICVMGAGTMGNGIAQVFAGAGHDVALYASSPESAARHKDKMAKGLARQVEKGRMAQADADALLARVKIGMDEDKCAADLIIDSIVEKMEPKKALLAELDKVAKADCIFATNTSSLSISEMGKGISHGLVGMHFFNPVPVMKLVEVTSSTVTKPGTAEKVTELAVALGKTPVQIKEAPGFAVNRILIPMINEAICTLEDGVASAEDIDTAMKLGANHPMGPLALSDLIGNDVVLDIMEVLHRELGEKYKPCKLLIKMVEEKKLGRKTGVGFFEYNSK